MRRYFIEVSYKGTAYAGFQIQQNADTVQERLENALYIYYKEKISLTGSSRTDAGVHALQNFFHFDTLLEISAHHIYNLNSLLPGDIAVRKLIPVSADAHCRFDARARHYRYDIYWEKDPFKEGFAYFYPYPVDQERLQGYANEFLGQHDFSSFSKRNTQVKTFICALQRSEWVFSPDGASFFVSGNRFLRGMVRGLVGTMLQLSRKQATVEELGDIIASGDCRGANFSVPGKGLWLEKVVYPDGYFDF